MKFSEVVKQAVMLLQESQRITYRALKLEFDLTDEQVETLKDELLFTHPEIADEGGRGLTWTGAGGKGETESKDEREKGRTSDTATPTQPPVSYTPSHLADRIRAATITDGERKTITALFADLKGSTALIEGLDPKEARAILDPALQLMMDAVHRYEGYVAQALGDGIFALFGAPIAHEDHPQRALYAALRMQGEMHRYSDEIRLRHGVPLAMRVGINTGEVVVRSIRKDDLHTDYVPVGHSTNLAACMEQMATPGSILVTAYTHKLTDGYFAFKALGETQIKGVEEPLHIYEVLGAGPLRTRLQVTATRRGLTRFVGRQSEMEQIQRALAQATAGRGQIVGVMGEPGLGKSRLFYEFKLLSQAGCLLLEAYSVSHGKASPYLPVMELLKSYFDIKAEDDERKRREKLTGKVLTLDRSLEATLPHLFALLGIEEQPSPLQQMDAQIRRRRTFDALKKLFLRESLNQPLILIFEDLQWIDSETQGFLDTLSESIASAKILLLVNYRPEYRHEWGQKTYYTQLRLAPFGQAEAEEFLDVLLGATVGAQHAAPLQQLKHLILDKSEGTPFFMEEIVQELVEQGVLVRDGVGAGLVPAQTGRPQGSPLQIPTTVQGVLAARIDRLALEEKALLQQLAVIGREFSLGLIRQVITQSEDERHRLLSSLQHKEFLYEQPAFPEMEYLFKHALTQEVAYNSMLIERRKALHEETARAMEQLYHERLDEHYDELAHHYQRSGNTEKAIDYLLKAGQLAVQRSANAEAIHHFAAALNWLKTLPDTPARAQQELTVQIALGAPLRETKGFAAPEVKNVCTRARELCQQIGEPVQHFAVLDGWANFHHMRGDLETAKAIINQAFPIAEQTQNPLFLARAHNGLGAALSFLGDQVAAWDQLEQGLTLADSLPLRSANVGLVFDPALDSRTHAARLLWLLGFPDHALRRGTEAVALAREQGQAATLCVPLTFAAWCHLLRGEADKARELADALIAVATEHGFAFSAGMGKMLRGRALVQQGQLEEGLILFQQGWTERQATGSRLNHPYNSAFLAETYGKMGQTIEGLTLVTEALTVVQATHEAWWAAEIYRLKGELTLQLETRDWRLETGSSSPQASSLKPLAPMEVAREAEEYFLKAIEIAKKQQAKSLELRAVMSLVRLRQQQSQDHATRTTQHGSSSTQHVPRTKLAEAHQMLSEIYTWFTEGFDTKDLQEAKALSDLGKTRVP
jgi:class 3 adenylate cyclase/predicted ATPase